MIDKTDNDSIIESQENSLIDSQAEKIYGLIRKTTVSRESATIVNLNNPKQVLCPDEYT